MNDPINAGGSAFPYGQVSELTGQPINGFFDPGMTLRDWFAGQALVGIAQAITQAFLHKSAQTPDDEITAKWAYGAADAMLAARQVKTD